MSIDIHIMPRVNIANFPELLSGQRGACLYFVVDTVGDLNTPEVTGLEKHVGSLAMCRDTGKIWRWDGTVWVKT